jgi:hypothetical protein
MPTVILIAQEVSVSTSQTISQDACLKTTTTKTLSQNACIKTTTSKRLFARARIKDTFTSTLSQNAYLRQQTTTHPLSQNATIRFSSTSKDLDQNAHIKTTTTRTWRYYGLAWYWWLSQNAWIKEVSSQTLTQNACLRDTTTQSLSQNATVKSIINTLEQNAAIFAYQLLTQNAAIRYEGGTNYYWPYASYRPKIQGDTPWST